MPGSVGRSASAFKERNPPIRGHFVLPTPEEGLAGWLGRIMPSTALTFSTPGVRVPVRPLECARVTLEAHEHRAIAIWEHGWTPREELRVLNALDVDRRTLGARYLALVQRSGWLTHALEQAGLGWTASLLLAERLTQPVVTFFDAQERMTSGARASAEAPWPDLGDTRRGAERLLTPYRHVALAVLMDLRPLASEFLGAEPLDVKRRPSALLQAAAACGITRAVLTDPPTFWSTKGAANAQREGRRLLAAIGAWPWVLFDMGALPAKWWTEPTVRSWLGTWLARARGLDPGWP